MASHEKSSTPSMSLKIASACTPSGFTRNWNDRRSSLTQSTTMTT
jgi:hypothetical protein